MNKAAIYKTKTTNKKKREENLKPKANKKVKE